jgi:hypothetical protein
MKLREKCHWHIQCYWEEMMSRTQICVGDKQFQDGREDVTGIEQTVDFKYWSICGKVMQKLRSDSLNVWVIAEELNMHRETDIDSDQRYRHKISLCWSGIKISAVSIKWGEKKFVHICHQVVGRNRPCEQKQWLLMWLGPPQYVPETKHEIHHLSISKTGNNTNLCLNYPYFWYERNYSPHFLYREETLHSGPLFSIEKHDRSLLLWGRQAMLRTGWAALATS